MAKSADEKRTKILETAKKRFAHYGMAKTTMAEIAKDLAFSKALLYYYFPDKISLYAAVMEHIIEETKQSIEDSISKTTDELEAINLLLERSMEFKKRYFYLLEYTFLIRKDLPADLDRLIFKSFGSHENIIQSILEKGVEAGRLIPMDAQENSRLFICSTLGMRMSFLKDFKSDFIPDKSEFDAILDMQKKLAKIFIRGLQI